MSEFHLREINSFSDKCSIVPSAAHCPRLFIKVCFIIQERAGTSRHSVHSAVVSACRELMCWSSWSQYRGLRWVSLTASTSLFRRAGWTELPFFRTSGHTWTRIRREAKPEDTEEGQYVKIRDERKGK